jgi:peptidoglycan LD-endopeptidase CwlK
MTGYALGKLSLDRLEGVHPDLIQVVKRAIQISPVDFMVVEGMRTLERQKKLVAEGKSTTMNSRHLSGHAVDLAAYVDGELEWGEPEHDHIAEAMKTAASELGHELEWGGDWKSFVDPPHFQLSWKAYPKQAAWTNAPTATAQTDKEIAKDLAKNSTKYKTASKGKQVIVGGGILVSLQQMLANFGETLSGFAGTASLEQIIKLMNQINALVSDIWVGLIASAAMAVWYLLGWFQKRQVQEIKKGTYQPSKGEF